MATVRSESSAISHHHERFDGTGYPDVLAGDDIPLAARIVTMVDVWDALSSERPYKPAYGLERVRSIPKKGRGTEFDPEILDLFLRILDEKGEELQLDLARVERPQGRS